VAPDFCRCVDLHRTRTVGRCPCHASTTARRVTSHQRYGRAAGRTRPRERPVGSAVLPGSARVARLPQIFVRAQRLTRSAQPRAVHRHRLPLGSGARHAAVRGTATADPRLPARSGSLRCERRTRRALLSDADDVVAPPDALPRDPRPVAASRAGARRRALPRRCGARRAPCCRSSTIAVTPVARFATTTWECRCGSPARLVPCVKRAATGPPVSTVHRAG